MSTRIYREALCAVDSQWHDTIYKIWDHTPWVIDVECGGRGPEGWLWSIEDYCRLNFGPRPSCRANWHVSCVCIQGWTWIGFHTKEMAEQFIANFPGLTKPLEL